MGIIAVVVFVGIFAVIALPLMAAAPSNHSKQARAALDAVLKTEPEVRQQTMNLRKDEQVSSIPWLDKWLQQLDIVAQLHRLLSQAAVDWSPSRLLLSTGVGFVLLFYVVDTLFHSLPLALVAGVVGAGLPIGWVVFMRHRRFAAFEKGLPEALDLMVGGLRAGHSLLAAISLVAKECQEPVKSEFRVCFEEQNYGLELKTALDNLLSRVPLQDLKITAAAIVIQKESGGNLAEVLDKTAQVIRDRFRLRRQIKTYTAQGRLTGWILTLLPVGLGFAVYMLAPDMISILWHRKIGLYMLWGAGGLILVGGFVINKIVSIDI